MADPATPPPTAARPQLNLPPAMSRSSLSLETLPSNPSHIDRLINSSYSHSPSRTICSDRFIPSRSASNFALFNMPSSSSSPSTSSSAHVKDDNSSASSTAYTAALRAALLGPDTPDRTDSPFPARNIFRYRTETKRSLHSLFPLGFEEADPTILHSPVKAARKVARSPFKVSLHSKSILASGFLSCYQFHVLQLKFKPFHAGYGNAYPILKK